MSTEVSNAEKRTDSTNIQPDTIFLGVDSFGSHHVFRSDDDMIHVIAPMRAEREAVVDVQGRELEGWMQDIAATRGWMSPEYGILTVDAEKFRPNGY